MGKKGHDFQQKCGDFFRHGSHDAVVFTLMKVKLAMVGAKEKIPQESPTTLKEKKEHLTIIPIYFWNILETSHLHFAWLN